ncbi:MAG TPA: YolD-like family protein [Candidatus Izemoplasmatales bacterium]|nr:YolD-like family protein [Candidatus Izemoplasmatales bacterium]
MPSYYVDRGLIKWAPFNALNGYHSMLDEMKHRIKKRNKPVLSDDEYDQLNRIIQEALNRHSDVEIHYYDHGYIKVSFGLIKKLDFIYKTLVLTTEEKIPAVDVLKIEIIA